MSQDPLPPLDEAIELIFTGCTTRLAFEEREVAFMRYVVGQERRRQLREAVYDMIERRAAELARTGDEAAKREIDNIINDRYGCEE